MVVVPALTGLTSPEASIVATATVELAHGVVLEGVPDPDNVVVLPIQTEVVPLIVGVAFTV